MDTDGEARHIHDEHKPAVAMRLVGMLFPLEYQPEHHSCECRRIGIHLALDGTKPEGVAEGVDE